MAKRKRHLRTKATSRDEEAIVCGVEVEDVIAFDIAAASTNSETLTTKRLYLMRRGTRVLPSRKTIAPSSTPSPYEGPKPVDGGGFDIIGGVNDEESSM